MHIRENACGFVPRLVVRAGRSLGCVGPDSGSGFSGPHPRSPALQIAQV